MSSTETDIVRQLAALVVKSGVGLGVMAPAQRALSLGFVWRALPQGVPMSEREVNAALRALLADTVSWLATDHVELRRWLVDTGWLRRDGWGREYRSSVPQELGAQALPLAAALADLDPVAFTRERRAAQLQRREARRHDWLAARGASA